MTTLIALLRGINVIGNNKLPMKELSALLTGMGLRDVQTYIQSGNVVFRCDLKSKATLAAKISAAIKAQHGFAPHVLLLEAAELKKVMAGNPYPEAVAAPKSLHLFFLDEAPQHPDLKALDAIKADSERYKLANKVFYLHTPDDFGNFQTRRTRRKVAGRGSHRTQLEHRVQAGGDGRLNIPPRNAR